MMGYTKQVYIQAEAELNARRSSAQRRAEEKLDAFYAAVPEAETLRRRIASTASKAAKAVLRGTDVRDTLEALKTENLELQRCFAALLAENGLTRADIEPQYACPACGDTGYVDGRMCACHLQLLRQIAYENLNSISPLTLSTFDSFSLDYYGDTPQDGRSDREQMRSIFEFCKRYAANFSADSGNLLFAGATGLGKTHLSLAIAAEVVQRGFGVVYGTAQTFAVALERERFAHNGDEGGDTLDLLTSCDLLILDDLGMEISSSYITAMLYNVVDSRIMLRRSTIITTNLSMLELEKRYNERFVSRVLGFYDHLRFRGADIRTKKKLRTLRGTPQT